MKVELGSGHNPTRQGYKTQDVRDLPGVDYVCDACDIDKLIEPETVKVFYSRHFFEHLTYAQSTDLLKKCLTLLEKQGRMEIVMPDMDFHARQWLDKSRWGQVNPNGLTNYEWAVRGFWGGQRNTETMNDFEATTELWDTHKSGHCFESLASLMHSTGYKEIQRVRSHPKNLHVIGVKL